jgi:hypothetical protein
MRMEQTFAQNEKRTSMGACSFFGAESRNRTGTMFPPRDFESRASTYSAISATQPLLSPICSVRATTSVCLTLSFNKTEAYHRQLGSTKTDQHTK